MWFVGVTRHYTFLTNCAKKCCYFASFYQGIKLMKWIQLSRLQPDLWSAPRVLIVFTTQPYEALPISVLRTMYPDLLIMGMSSHHGVFTPEGFKRGSYGLLFEGEEGERFCASLMTFEADEDIRQKVVSSVSRLEPLSAERRFMMYCIPGFEERVIEGLREVLGSRADVLGGSAGYDLFLEQPYVFLNDAMTTCGVLLAETDIAEYRSINAMAGYHLSEKRGIATRAQGRILYEIDHRNASSVYDEWTDGMFSTYLEHDGLLPRSAAKFPLGRLYQGNHEFGIWLTHVYGVQTHALMLFAEIAEGTEICLTRGSSKQILDNLKSAIDRELQKVERQKVCGALVYFCSGCTNLVAESIKQISMSICESLGNIPFIGASTMGEQGCLANQPLQHGNMMIGITLFMQANPTLT